MQVLVLPSFPDTLSLPFCLGSFGLDILGPCFEARGMWKQEAGLAGAPWRLGFSGRQCRYDWTQGSCFVCFRVNVCGGQCCHGWSKAPGSQRCTKRKFPCSQQPCTVGEVGLSTRGIPQGPLEEAMQCVWCSLPRYLKPSSPPRKGWARVMMVSRPAAIHCTKPCRASKIPLHPTVVLITLLPP